MAAIGMAASITAFAQSQMPTTSATVVVKKQPVVQKPTVEKTRGNVSSPFILNPLKARPSKVSDKVIYIDGMSNQPWYRMAGTRPGWSAFPQPGKDNLGLTFFWVGAEPSR